MREKVVLLMCGSFNPVTNMHLRMMEIARDHLFHCGYIVKGGFISPVHDSYPKTDLLSITHRMAMLKHAIETSDWLQLSTWESEQCEWTPTFKVLQYHQDRINDLLSVKNINKLAGSNRNDINYNPDSYDVTVKLVCGADFLSSFLVPNLWDVAHIEQIVGKHGLVVITRTDYNIADIIDDHDILFKHMNKIIVVTEFIKNAISSTKIRKACARGRSIKYLVNDNVEQYIKIHKLYSYSKYKYENDTKDSIRITANLFNNYKPKLSVTKRKSVASTENNTKNKVPRNKNQKKVRARFVRQMH